MYRFSKQGQTMVRIDRVISEQISVHRQRPYLTRVDVAVEPVLARWRPAAMPRPAWPSALDTVTILRTSGSLYDRRLNVSDVPPLSACPSVIYLADLVSRTAIFVCLGRCALVPQSLSSVVLSSISIGHPLGAKLSTNRRLTMAVSPFACGNFASP